MSANANSLRHTPQVRVSPPTNSGSAGNKKKIRQKSVYKINKKSLEVTNHLDRLQEYWISKLVKFQTRLLLLSTLFIKLWPHFFFNTSNALRKWLVSFRKLCNQRLWFRRLWFEKTLIRKTLIWKTLIRKTSIKKTSIRKPLIWKPSIWKPPNWKPVFSCLFYATLTFLNPATFWLFLPSFWGANIFDI